jgi:HK97 family phage portal protein
LVAPTAIGRPVAKTQPGISLLQSVAPFSAGSATWGLPGAYVYDAQSARRIPAVARALQLFTGFCKQMPLEAFRGYERIDPTPRLLTQPDPTRGVGWFIQVSVEDYLLNGNAIGLITARGFDGWPLACAWLPSDWVFILYDQYTGTTQYSYLGEILPFDNVVHVRRGADRLYPGRGVGVVEEFLSSLDRVAMEEDYERGALSDGAVPSVAIITPQATLTEEVADQASAQWAAKFSGPVRQPVILPNGTVVQPLAWSPTDAQLTEARKASLLDVANIFNLDGYWVGSPTAGITYKTAEPQYQQALRTSLEPVLTDFEDAWSAAWLPRGTNVRFQRSQLLREDLATSTTAAVALKNAGITSLAESRILVGLPPEGGGSAGIGADTPADANVASPDDPNAPTPDTGETGGDTPS